MIHELATEAHYVKVSVQKPNPSENAEDKTEMRSPESCKDDVLDALRDLGGEAHVSQIYERVLVARNRRGDPIDGYRAWVRGQLWRNSDCRGTDVFEHVGDPSSGVWRLKG